MTSSDPVAHKNYYQQNWEGRKVNVVAALQQNALQQNGASFGRHHKMPELPTAPAFCDAAYRIQPRAASILPLWKVSKVLLLSTMQNCIPNVGDLFRR